MNKTLVKLTAGCLSGVMVLTAGQSMVFASATAGASSSLANIVSEAEVSTSLTAGVSKTLVKCIENADTTQTASADTTDKAQTTENEADTVKSEYADIAIAQVDNYVNIRDAAGTEGAVLGKLYNNSAATVLETDGEWSKITSGTVTGYVKSEYVVTGNEELAKSVGTRLATVNTETLRVRTDASTDAGIVGLVPAGDDLVVTEEGATDGWVKVSMEEGEGYVSTDYVSLSTDYVEAESKEEEEARLAKEAAEREAANKAARAAEKSAASSSSSSSSAATSSAAPTYSAPTSSNGSAVVSYACQFVGNPYVYGGTSLTNGADCSGFVMSVYAAFGVSLPHSSSALRSVGYEVSQADMQPGDIICYSGHVAIYCGGDTIVHASTAETGIKYTSPAAYRSIITVRRIF